MESEMIPPAAGDHYAALKNAQQHKGMSLDENDLWIAATAIALSAVLVTRDADYSRVEGLALANWAN